MDLFVLFDADTDTDTSTDTETKTNLRVMGFLRGSFLITFVSLLTVAVLLNSLMLFSQFTLRNYSNSSTNIFVAFLGCCNIVILLFVLPTFIIDIVATEASGGGGRAFQCVIGPYIQMLSISSNIFCMIVIVADLYRAVRNYRSPANRRSWAVRSLVIVCAASIIYSCRTFVALHQKSAPTPQQQRQPNNTSTDTAEVPEYRPELLSTPLTEYSFVPGASKSPYSDRDRTENGTYDDTDTVTDNYNDDYYYVSCNIWIEKDDNDVFYRLFDAACLFVFPVIVQAILYGLVIRKLWSSHVALGSAARTHHTRSVVRMCGTVLASFCFCWGPWHFTDMIADSLYGDQDPGYVEGFRQVVTLLAFCNSWTTPVIYALFNVRIRTQMVAIVTCRRRDCRPVRPRVARVAPIAVVTDHSGGSNGVPPENRGRLSSFGSGARSVLALQRLRRRESPLPQYETLTAELTSHPVDGTEWSRDA